MSHANFNEAPGGQDMSEDRDVKTILVCGGAGYIGSHTVLELVRQSHAKIIVLDNLSTGYPHSIPKNDRVSFIKGDINDADFIDKQVFSKHQIDAVMVRFSITHLQF
jgi:UDP-glucose 4-epimerase